MAAFQASSCHIHRTRLAAGAASQRPYVAGPSPPTAGSPETAPGSAWCGGTSDPRQWGARWPTRTEQVPAPRACERAGDRMEAWRAAQRGAQALVDGMAREPPQGGFPAPRWRGRATRRSGVRTLHAGGRRLRRCRAEVGNRRVNPDLVPGGPARLRQAERRRISAPAPDVAVLRRGDLPRSLDPLTSLASAPCAVTSAGMTPTGTWRPTRRAAASSTVAAARDQGSGPWRLRPGFPKPFPKNPRTLMAWDVAVVFDNNARDYALRDARRVTELLTAADEGGAPPP